jgi:hypothetical protein
MAKIFNKAVKSVFFCFCFFFFFSKIEFKIYKYGQIIIINLFEKIRKDRFFQDDFIFQKKNRFLIDFGPLKRISF